MHVQDRVSAIVEHRIPPVRGRTKAKQNVSGSVSIEFQHEDTRGIRGIAPGVAYAVGANRLEVHVRRTVQRRRCIPKHIKSRRLPIKRKRAPRRPDVDSVDPPHQRQLVAPGIGRQSCTRGQ